MKTPSTAVLCCLSWHQPNQNGRYNTEEHLRQRMFLTEDFSTYMIINNMHNLAKYFFDANQECYSIGTAEEIALEEEARVMELEHYPTMDRRPTIHHHIGNDGVKWYSTDNVQHEEWRTWDSLAYITQKSAQSAFDEIRSENDFQPQSFVGPLRMLITNYRNS